MIYTVLYHEVAVLQRREKKKTTTDWLAHYLLFVCHILLQHVHCILYIVYNLSQPIVRKCATEVDSNRLKSIDRSFFFVYVLEIHSNSVIFVPKSFTDRHRQCICTRQWLLPFVMFSASEPFKKFIKRSFL